MRPSEKVSMISEYLWCENDVPDNMIVWGGNEGQQDQQELFEYKTLHAVGLPSYEHCSYGIAGSSSGQTTSHIAVFCYVTARRQPTLGSS